MLENSMIVGRERHDTQCREYETFICAYCGDELPVWEKEEGIDAPCCTECAKAYCKEQAALEGVRASFIAKHEQDFLEWFWEGLEPAEKLSAMRTVYLDMCLDVWGRKKEEYREQEKEFCMEHDEFSDYVKEGAA